MDAIEKNIIRQILIVSFTDRGISACIITQTLQAITVKWYTIYSSTVLKNATIIWFSVGQKCLIIHRTTKTLSCFLMRKVTS